MSIQSEINRISGNISDSLDEVALKGVTVPAGSNSDDLPGLIRLIEQSGGSGVGGVIYQDEDGYLVLSEEAANVIGITRTLDENGGEILDIVGVSLANDTVTPATLAQGVTAHNAAGEAIVGTMSGGGGDELLDFIKGVSRTIYNEPRITSLRRFVFSYDTNISTYVLSGLTGEIGASCFASNETVRCVDFGNPSIINTACFRNTTNLNTIIIRGNSVTELGAANTMFTSSPFGSGGAGGTLYVPQSLKSQYEQATNWSTILGYTNNQIKSIESTHTDPNASIDLTLYYADGTPIPTT